MPDSAFSSKPRFKYLVHFLGILFFIFTVLFVSTLPFEIPNKLVVSLILGILLFALYEYILPETKFNLRVGSNRKFCIRKIIPSSLSFYFLFLLVYIISFVIVVLPLPVPSQSLHTVWGVLGALAIIKLAATLLLTCLLPGYAIITIIRLNEPQAFLTKTGIGVLSVLFSFLLSSSVIFFHWVIVGGFSGLNYTMFLYYALFFLFFIVLIFWKRHKFSSSTQENNAPISTRSISKIVILISISAFLIWGFYSSHFETQTLPIIGDELNHVGLVLQFSNGWQSWQAIQTGSGLYPYFFHLTVLGTASLSGISAINAYLSFFFILLLPAFSFYFMLKLIFRNKSLIPLVSTVIFSIFSGFGWIYVDYLRVSSSITSDVATISTASIMTYDVIYSTWLPLYIAPYALDLSIFLILLGLIYYKNIKPTTLFVLMASLTALGSLVHVEKMLILSLLLFVLTSLYFLNIKFIKYPKTVLSSFSIGLLIFLMLDSIAPYKILSQSISMVWYGLLISVFSLLLIAAIDRFRNKIPHLNSNFKNSLNKYGIYIIIILYFLLWIAFLFSFNSYAFNGNIVPFWFLPLKMGVAGLLAVFGVFYCTQKENNVRFFVALAGGTLLLEIMLYHLPFSLVSTDFSEFRVIRDVLWPFLSVIAAYGLINLVRITKTRLCKNGLRPIIIVCLLIFAIFVAAVPSHLLKVEYFALNKVSLSSEEIASLNFVSTLKVPLGSFILTVLPKQEIYAITGAQLVSLADPVYGPLIFNSKSSTTTLSVLQYLNISYIYLDYHDLQYISNNYADSFFTWFLPNIPLVFNNSATSIYEVPPFSSSLDQSNTAVVTGDLIQNSDILQNSIWVDDTFDEGWHFSSAHYAENPGFTTNGSIAELTAKTTPEQQAAAFYYKALNQKIVTNSTMEFIKFKSDNSFSYLILDLLYSDGSTQRVQLAGQTYLNSLEWTTITTYLQPNKTLQNIRIGITDNKEGNGEIMGVSVDYLGIAELDVTENYYVTSQLASLMQINYTAISKFDSSLFDCNTIFLPDLNFSSTETTRYLNWIQNGGTMIIVHSSGPGTFSNFLEASYRNNSYLANSIIDNYGLKSKMAETSVSKMQLGNNLSSIVANYAFENTLISPLALIKNVEKGRIIYLDVSPLSQIAGNQETLNSVTWLRSLLQNYTDISTVNQGVYTRTFYLKNIGNVLAQGEISIETSNMLFDFENLNVLNLSFSNSSQVIRSNLTKDDVFGLDVTGFVPLSVTLIGNCTISPIDSADYVNLKLKGTMFLQFEITSKNSVKVFSENVNDANKIFNNCTLLLQTAPLSQIDVILKNPMITVNGTTSFESLYVSYPYGYQSAGDPALLTGYAQFKLVLSEERVMLIGDFQTNGQLDLVLNTQSVVNDDLLFFKNFLPEFILTITILTIAVAIFIIPKKQVKKDF